MTEKYIQPQFRLNVFTCPHCGAITEQQWNECLISFYNAALNRCEYYATGVSQTRCVACNNLTLWITNKASKNSEECKGELGALGDTPKTDSQAYQMIYPQALTICPPVDNMPECIKELYEEARSIAHLSPRGAAALLRLALDKLCDEVCEDCKQAKFNGKIDQKIGVLVANGLSSKLQKAFDFVRVTGNDAVHELGLIDIQDNPEIVNALFALLNLITEKMITENKEIDNLYNLIPESRRDKIEERNKKAKGANNA